MSALKSYHDFCHAHGFPIEPTADTLSFFLTYRSLILCPQTLSSYLSGICDQLEVFYPRVCKLCRLPVVGHTLAGIHCVHSVHIHCKRPLVPADLQLLISEHGATLDHNDLLFLLQVLVGFNQLLQLTELCSPDDDCLYNVCKYMKRYSLIIDADTVHILLPTHKADKIFSRLHLLIRRDTSPIFPLPSSVPHPPRRPLPMAPRPVVKGRQLDSPLFVVYCLSTMSWGTPCVQEVPPPLQPLVSTMTKYTP